MLLFIIFTSCKSSSVKTTVNEKEYTVLSIDSINNVYVIHAKKDSLYFKILSFKTEGRFSKCNKIQTGKSYDFKLNPGFLSDDRFSINLDGIWYHGETIRIERDSIYDLHEAKNLKGLCFKK